MSKGTRLSPDGYVTVTGPPKVIGSRGIVETDTLQCPHCGCHWDAAPGKKRSAYFCSRCNRAVCGPKCTTCVPQEQQLENMEQGRPTLFMPSRDIRGDAKPTSLWIPGD